MAGGLPQGTVTVLFTDVEGSTDLATSRGDDAAHEIMRGQRELVRKQIEEHGGHEVKTMGDGFMVAFDSARRGVACATGIQIALDEHNRRHPDRQVRVRMGLNTGEAISEERDLFGLTVTAAERISNKAKSGEILVSDAVRAVLGPAQDVRLSDRGRFRLKGFADKWRLYEVEWRDRIPAPVPVATEDLTPFVGRDRECGELTEALDRLAAGRGSLVFIAGQSGVGKTRLAEELAASARDRGMLTFSGHCYEDSGAPPYLPVIEILETAARTLKPAAFRTALGDALPDVARLVPALWRLAPQAPKRADRHPDRATAATGLEPRTDLARLHLFNALRDFLARAGAIDPVVLVLDDLQWADDSTVLLLQHVARGLSQMRVLIVATVRDGVQDNGQPLTRAIEELERKRLAQRIELQGLPAGGVRELLGALSKSEPPDGFVEAMHAATEGNPYFVEELFRHLNEEGRVFDAAGHWRPGVEMANATVPRGVRAVIERRLAHLHTDTRRVLTDAAAIGRAFRLDLLELVSDVHDDALLDAVDEAERGRVIIARSHGPDPPFDFANELIRTMLLAGLASAQRQRLHLRVAQAMERLYANALNDHAATLAHHYVAAGRLADPGHVVAVLCAAADSATRMRVHSEAETHYEGALRLIEAQREFSHAEHARVLYELGKTEYALGNWDRSRVAFDKGLALYEELGLAEDQAEVLFAMGSLAMFRAQAREALDHLARAKQRAGSRRRLQGLIAELESQALVQSRQYAQAEEAIAEARAIAAEVNDSYLTVRVHIASGFFHLATLAMGPAVEDFSLALETSPISMNERMASEYRRAIALAALGRLDEAAARGAAARSFFEQDPYEAPLSCLPEVMAALARGRFDDALAIAASALAESGDPPGAWAVQSLAPAVFEASYYLGRPDEAAQLMASYVAHLARGGRPPTIARAFPALLDAAEGDASTEDAEELRAIAHRPDLQSIGGQVLSAETAIMLRSRPLAESHYPALADLLERELVFTPGWVSLLPRLLGALCILREEWRDAQAFLERALDTSQRTGAEVELAMTHLELAELSACRPPEYDGAVSHLESAQRLFSERGVTVCARRISSVSDRLGVAAPVAASAKARKATQPQHSRRTGGGR